MSDAVIWLLVLSHVEIEVLPSLASWESQGNFHSPAPVKQLIPCSVGSNFPVAKAQSDAKFLPPALCSREKGEAREAWWVSYTTESQHFLASCYPETILCLAWCLQALSSLKNTPCVLISDLLSLFGVVGFFNKQHENTWKIGVNSKHRTKESQMQFNYRSCVWESNVKLRDCCANCFCLLLIFLNS